MNKKTIFQIALLVVLASGGIYWLSGLFKPAKIQILCDIHPPRMLQRNPRPASASPQFDVAFGFDQKYRLTDLKVVVLDEWTTNKQAHPLWHMVSASNAIPTKAIIYGQWINGMHPAVLGKHAEPLQPNVNYRLIIEAGSRTGDCDFKLPAQAAIK
ncbi:MAG: hypothetical protein PHY43_10480 [Verrucomicrobiales bacterium]|nr:hypothetical protein [Verrucomicrobiales bacterium]